jgi:hypothetical protein
MAAKAGANSTAAVLKVAKNLSIGSEYLYTNYVDDDYVVRVSALVSRWSPGPFRIVANGTDMRRQRFLTCTISIFTILAARF